MTKETHLLVLLHHILPNTLFVFLQELTFHWPLTDRTGKWLGLFSWSHDSKHGSQFPLMFRLGGCQFSSKWPVSTALLFQIVDIANPVLDKSHSWVRHKQDTHIQGDEPAPWMTTAGIVVRLPLLFEMHVEVVF